MSENTTSLHVCGSRFESIAAKIFSQTHKKLTYQTLEIDQTATITRYLT